MSVAHLAQRQQVIRPNVPPIALNGEPKAQLFIEKSKKSQVGLGDGMIPSERMRLKGVSIAREQRLVERDRRAKQRYIAKKIHELGVDGWRKLSNERNKASLERAKKKGRKK